MGIFPSALIQTLTVVAWLALAATAQAAVSAAAPDVILMMDRCGGPSTPAADLFAMPAIAITPAAEDEALVTMNGLLLLGFGPRTGGGAPAQRRALRRQDLRGALHPTGRPAPPVAASWSC